MIKTKKEPHELKTTLIHTDRNQFDGDWLDLCVFAWE